MLCIIDELANVRPFLQRGRDVANACKNFIVVGYKEDTYATNHLMTHAIPARVPVQGGGTVAVSPEMAFRSTQAWDKLRAFYLNQVHPKVMKHCGVLLRGHLRWIEENGLNLFAAQVNV